MKYLRALPPILLVVASAAFADTLVQQGNPSHNLPGWKNQGTVTAGTAVATGLNGGPVLPLVMGIVDDGGSVQYWTGTSGGVASVQGTKSNNTVVPGASNLGVLPGIANATAPTYTEGFQVLQSLDLHANTRTVDYSNQTTNSTVNTIMGLVGGSVTTADPTYTTGQGAAISLNPAGGVRVGNATASNFFATAVGAAAAGASPTGNPLFVPTYIDGSGHVQFRGAGKTATSGVSTSTALLQLIAAPGASLSIYITDIIYSSSAAATASTNEQLNLYSGTGTNCGSTSNLILPAFNIANGGYSHPFQTPLPVAANTELCWIAAAAGSKGVTVNYFIGP